MIVKAMKRNKEKDEEILIDMLHEMLRDYNQEGALQSLTINEDGKSCTVCLSVDYYEGNVCFQAP